MLSARGVLERLLFATVGDDPLPDGGWLRITEAADPGSNWSASLSPGLSSAQVARWEREVRRLSSLSPHVLWSEVTSWRGPVREFTHYLD